MDEAGIVRSSTIVTNPRVLIFFPNFSRGEVTQVHVTTLKTLVAEHVRQDQLRAWV